MPIAAVAIAAVGLGLSVYQTVDAKKKQKEAEKAAKEFERQQLKNPYEDLQVSTLGAQLQQQNLNNQVGTAVDTLRAGGTRAILGGLPTIYDNVIQANNQIAAGLDQQYNQNQQLSAQGKAMVQNMQEQRDTADLLGIGNAIDTYRNEYNQGLGNIVKSGTALVQAGQAAGIGSGGSQNNSESSSGNDWSNSLNGLNFNNSKIQPTNQPTNAIQANLYQNQLDQYGNYLIPRRRF